MPLFSIALVLCIVVGWAAAQYSCPNGTTWQQYAQAQGSGTVVTWTLGYAFAGDEDGLRTQASTSVAFAQYAANGNGNIVKLWVNAANQGDAVVLGPTLLDGCYQPPQPVFGNPVSSAVGGATAGVTFGAMGAANPPTLHVRSISSFSTYLSLFLFLSFFLSSSFFLSISLSL